MNRLKQYNFSDLYRIDSGISTSPSQAGHGAPFLSFSTIFNNEILPEELPDKMDTSEIEQEKYSVKKGDIFLTRTSETLDELAMSSVAVKDYPEATFSGFAKRLRPLQNDITYDKFMAFYLRSPYFRKIIDANAVMTLRASFNEDIFSYIKLWLPDYEIQVGIGDFFWNIEQKIRVNRKITASLEEMAKLLYDYWFVQFDFPDENGKPYKSSGGKMVWNDELKREIPEGWEVGNIIDNVLTSVIKNGVDLFESKNYLPTANVVGETITDGDWVTYENRESRANMQPTKYSVWFAKMKNSVKHISIPDDSEWFIEKYILSTGLEGIQCDEQSFGYIHCIVNSDYFERYKDTVAHGATQESVNDDDLRNIKFVIPSRNTLNQFSKVINPILEAKFKSIYENQQLASLRDFLLPMMMNGQVKVGKAGA